MASNENGLFRLSPDIIAILGKVAEKKNFTETMVLETLVLKEALDMGIVGSHHPEIAFLNLINAIKGWSIQANENFTLNVFERIDSTPEVRRLWEEAVTPLPGQRADKRKQFVNQRL